MAVHTGLRSGELRALMWRDLDWRERRLTVQRNLDAAANGDPITSDPKTPSSRRTIHLSDDAVAYLKAQRQRVVQERLRAGGRTATTTSSSAAGGGRRSCPATSSAASTA